MQNNLTTNTENNKLGSQTLSLADKFTLHSTTHSESSQPLPNSPTQTNFTHKQKCFPSNTTLMSEGHISLMPPRHQNTYVTTCSITHLLPNTKRRTCNLWYQHTLVFPFFVLNIKSKFPVFPSVSIMFTPCVLSCPPFLPTPIVCSSLPLSCLSTTLLVSPSLCCSFWPVMAWYVQCTSSSMSLDCLCF